MSKSAGGKKSGWQMHDQARQAGQFSAEAGQPIAWERLLRELEISEDYALLVAQGQAEGPRLQLRNWVRLQRGKLFVPEMVLDALGFPVYEGEGRGPEPYSMLQAGRDRGVLPQAK